MDPEIEVLPNADDVAATAAGIFARAAHDAVSRRGRFVVLLSGGSTPGRLYRRLAEADGPAAAVPWRAVHVCWGDERHVASSDRDSNVRMARETLLDRVAIPADHVHPLDGGCADPEAEARRYDAELRRLFGIGEDDVPTFDLVLLGMGPDGHIASLFPRSPALAETRRLVLAPRVDRLNDLRLTVSPPVLLSALETIVLVTGREKAATLRSVFGNPPDPSRLPAQLLRRSRGRVHWLVDRDAASMLSNRPHPGHPGGDRANS